MNIPERFRFLIERWNIIKLKRLRKWINTGKIYWWMISQIPAAMNLLEKNPDKIDWHWLSINPAAINLLYKNPEKIVWENLSANPGAISLLEKNLDKVDWTRLSQNPAAIHLLEKYPDKIDWFWLSINPASVSLIYISTATMEKILSTEAFQMGFQLPSTTNVACAKQDVESTFSGDNEEAKKRSWFGYAWRTNEKSEPIVYCVHDLIRISESIPTVEKPLKNYVHMLEKDFWEATDQASLDTILTSTAASGEENKQVFLTPMSVLNDPDLSPLHSKRIQDANLKYPILADEEHDVLDGLHRLAKAYKENNEFIRVKILPKHILEALKRKRG